LEVSFGVSRAGHPEIYPFFLEDIGTVLLRLHQPRIQLVLERLEPLNAAYSHLNVSPKLMNQIFKRFCQSHGLKPFASFSPKESFSCKGNVSAQKLVEILEDYNLLFDIFFCDIRIQSKSLFLDAMDLFSNRVLVRSDSFTLKRFQQLVKKDLPKTRFRLV
jgi:hypothetical protein